MNRASYFGALTFLLGLVCFTLSVIALATTRWHYDFNLIIEFGLFEQCTFGQNRVNCLPLAEVLPYVRATQAFMIMGTILVALACLLALVVTFKKSSVKLNRVAGAIFLVAGLFFMIASSVYTGTIRPTLITSLLRFGYSLWMAWATTVVTFFTVPFAFLASREKEFLL